MPRQYEQIFKSLADENRRRILSVLSEGPQSAGDLARRVGLAPNALSFHLKDLRSAQLISLQRKGRHLYYELVPKALEQWLEHIQNLFAVSAGYAPPVAIPDDLKPDADTDDAYGQQPMDSSNQRRPAVRWQDEEQLPTELL
jgi:DNA-binding transcriptional ArsR family regulator